jgi:hypothetical protein
LLRTPTDEARVPLFTHPIHPRIIQEFVHEFGASWAVFGTPESGKGIMGALSPDTRCPAVAITRGDSHAKALKALIEDNITKGVLKRDSEWSVKTLADQWAALQQDDSTSSAVSCSSDTDDDVTGAGESRKKGKRKSKKNKSSSKGPKDKEQVKGEKHKKDKKHKDKSKDKKEDRSDKKGVKGDSSKKGDAGETASSSLTVLQKLLEEGSSKQ